MASYIALIHKERGSDYGVSFPDFPGCATAGSTLDEARANAAEALALHIEGMIEDGEPLPDPSDLAATMRDRESRDAVAILVDAPTRAGKAVRINITLPEDVLHDIDAFAEREGYSRSGFIAKAARGVLAGMPSSPGGRRGFEESPPRPITGTKKKTRRRAR